MSEKGPKTLFDSKLNIIKQCEIATKTVTAILSYINKNTVPRSYTTDLTQQFTSQYCFQLPVPYFDRNLDKLEQINR